jgi:hypothetical protein
LRVNHRFCISLAQMSARISTVSLVASLFVLRHIYTFGKRDTSSAFKMI